MSAFTRDDAYERVWSLWTVFMVTGSVSGSIPVPAMPCPAYQAFDDGDPVTMTPRPVRPYCTVKVHGLPDKASGYAYSHDGTQTATHTGATEFTTEFQVYGAKAESFLTTFTRKFGTDVMRRQLKSIGLGCLGVRSGPDNRSITLDTRTEPRAVMALAWRTYVTETETLYPVTSAEITVELQSVSGDTVVDKTVLTEL